MRVRVPSAAPLSFVFVVEYEWSSALSLKQVIAGSLPAHDAMGSNSTGGQRVVFQATIGRFDSGWPYQSSTAVPLVEVDLPLKQDVASSSLAGGTRMLGDCLTGKAADC